MKFSNKWYHGENYMYLDLLTQIHQIENPRGYIAIHRNKTYNPPIIIFYGEAEFLEPIFRGQYSSINNFDEAKLMVEKFADEMNLRLNKLLPII